MLRPGYSLICLLMTWLAVVLACGSVCAQPQALPPTVLPDAPPVLMPAPADSAGPTWLAPADAAPGPVYLPGAIGSPAPSLAPSPWADPWTWQLLPDGLMYRAYLASGRESRFASEWNHEKDLGWVWDVTLGGHVAVLRYGTQDPLWPEGWQFDMEGAAFPRLDIDRNLVTADFRFGLPLTVRQGPWEGKFGFYHLSSHLADEFMLAHPEVPRINYSRDVLVLAIAFRPTLDWRLYSEAGWATHTYGGSKPWEFQFGVEYSPGRPSGFCGAPFLAVNARLRQEVNYGGNFTAQAGWQWRGQSGHLARVGAVYFNGKSDTYQFFRDHEERIGVGIWYDY